MLGIILLVTGNTNLIPMNPSYLKRVSKENLSNPYCLFLNDKLLIDLYLKHKQDIIGFCNFWI